MVESVVNVAVGFGISLGAQIVFLPMLGVTVSMAQNFIFALIMTAYGADEAARRYAHLIACGFDEAGADTVFEAIDLPDSAAISLRISDLRALGFADPVKMITSSPPILGYAIDNIRGKISDLRALGFADPVKMITSSPTILGYALDNIRGKISDLRALGFADPVKMITTLPPILGYARERVVLCGRIIASLSDRSDGMLARIISKPRHAIDRIVVAAPSDWNGVLAVLKEAPR